MYLWVYIWVFMGIFMGDKHVQGVTEEVKKIK